MRWLVLLGIGLAGCRSAPAVAPVPSPAVRSSVAPVEPVRMPDAFAIARAPIESEPPVAIAPPIDVPMFARNGIDLEHEYPLRATVRTVGATFETAEGEGALPGSGASARFEAFVVDEGVGTSPRRVQLLCEHERHRVALFVEAADLMVTVRDEIPMFARPKWPKRVHERTPGVRLQPGAPLLVHHRPAKGFAFVRYEGDRVDATGFVPVRALDVVYTGERADWDAVPNAIVVEPARLHDQPGARVLARIGPPQAVEMLGPRNGKWRLVRWSSHDVAVVGWIDKKFLRRTITDVTDESRDAVPPGSGSGSAIVLPRGTTLVGREGDQALGVVTDERTASCVADCGSATPLVRVEACPTPIDVRAWLGR